MVCYKLPVAANTVCKMTLCLHLKGFTHLHVVISTDAVGCYEMSSLLYQGVNEVMDAVILAALNSHTHSKKTR